jgi:hypothetical protein
MSRHSEHAASALKGGRLAFNLYIWGQIPFHITISQTTDMKQIIDATKNPVRDEISVVKQSRKAS